MPYVSEECSPIRHLAAILWPPWVDRERAVFAMLTLAFDAGGDLGTDYLTVAGFASSMSDWDSFSTKWTERLNQDGIAFFRAVDANSFRGPFEHWRELSETERVERRKSLFSDLMDIIHSHVYQKVSCTVVNKDYASTDNEARQEFAESAYSLAARTCEKHARHWLMHDPWWAPCKHMRVAAIFELGDDGQDEGKMRDRLRKDYGHIPPTFKPKKDTPREDGVIEEGFVPLQAADWLAWEINRATRDYFSGAINSEGQMRWPMQQFLNRPSPYMGIYTIDELNEMNKTIDLLSRIPHLATVLNPEGKGRDTLQNYDANAKGQTA
jgi:hypothetical protein